MSKCQQNKPTQRQRNLLCESTFKRTIIMTVKRCKRIQVSLRQVEKERIMNEDSNKKLTARERLAYRFGALGMMPFMAWCPVGWWSLSPHTCLIRATEAGSPWRKLDFISSSPDRQVWWGDCQRGCQSSCRNRGDDDRCYCRFDYRGWPSQV